MVDDCNKEVNDKNITEIFDGAAHAGDSILGHGSYLTSLVCGGSGPARPAPLPCPSPIWLTD